MAELSPVQSDAPSRRFESAGNSQLADVFPLRLTPFEKFMLWDERNLQPMNSYIELHFASPLNTEDLEAALAVAVHRNPLLAARVVEHDGDWWWEYDPDYRPQLLDARRKPPLRDGWPIPICLREECGSRFWYHLTPSGSRLLIQLHHACCDGVGLRRVMIDALTGYASAVTSHLPADHAAAGVKVPRWEKLEASRLEERYDFSGAFSGPPAITLSTRQRLQNAHYFHFQLPQALRGGAEQAAASEVGTDQLQPLRHAIICRQLSQQILERSRQTGVGINELALALLFQTCWRWQTAHGDTRPNARLRLLMPYDLRSRSDLRMPAANRLSFTFLGRTYADCQDFPRLLLSVRREVKYIKDSRLPLDFLNALEFAAKHPRFTQWMMNRSRKMATAVLTYTGDISRGMKHYFPEEEGARRVGDARLTNILGAPPVRANTNIALGLCVNWGQLCLSAAWNRAAMTASECEGFLEFYAESWTRWLES